MSDIGRSTGTTGAARVVPGRTGHGRDPVGSHVGWKILREEHAVGVSPAEGRRGGGTAARRREEAGACAAQVREDAVDDARVGYEGNDPQLGRAGRAGKRLDLEHAVQELGPGEAPRARCARRVDLMRVVAPCGQCCVRPATSIVGCGPPRRVVVCAPRIAMLTREEIVARLRREREMLSSRYPIRRLALFGSWARGEARADSDVDVLVEVDSSIGLRFVDLAADLERAMGRRVDLVSRRAIKPSLWALIEPELIDA